MVIAIDFDVYEFACDGARWGLPHAWNVLTNIPFLLIGIWGLLTLRRGGVLRLGTFRNWTGLWISTALLSFGSGAYHFAPAVWSLAIDRVVICAMIAYIGAHALTKCLHVPSTQKLSLTMLVVCELSVVAWLLGVDRGWAYAALQAGGGVAVLVLYAYAWRKGRLQTSPKPIFLFTACYALAKVLEVGDAVVCDWTGVIGGHPFKHLLAALGLVLLRRMMTAEMEAHEQPVARG